MYEKDGEKYFIFDSHLHFWDASPDNWVKGAEQYAKGWIECFHAYQGLGPAGDALVARALPEVLGRGLREGRLHRRRHVDKAVFQSTYLKEWYTNGFNDIEQNGALLERFPGKLIVNGRWDPREGDGRPRAARGRPRQVRPQGRQALHRRVVQGLARLEADRRGGEAVLRQVRRARHQEHPRPQGPDDLAAGQGRLRRLRRRPRRDGLQRPAQLHRRARRPAADRGLLLHGDAGAQRLRRPRRWSSAASCTPARSSSRRSWASCCSGSARTRCCSAPTTRSGSRSGRSRASSNWEMPDDDGATRTSRGWTSTARSKILGLNAAKLYGVEVPGGAARERPGRRAGLRRKRSGRRDEPPFPSPRSARDGLRPGARRADHHARLRRLLGRDRRRRRVGAAAAPHAAVRAELRLPDGRRRPGRAGARPGAAARR